jgi:hypothetical protein
MIRGSIVLLALLSPMVVLGQRIEITPASAVAGEPVRIVLKGFARDADVTLVSERAVRPFQPGASPALYRAEAVFRTSHAGTLDLATATPRSGSYERADLRGLFWSMAPVAGEASVDRPPDQITLTAYQGGTDVATATLTVVSARAEVQVERVEAFPGAMFASLPGSVRRPAIIVLGGSEGGDWFAASMAPRLASYGYAVFGLPYYAPAFAPRDDLKNLPTAFVDIPVDRLQQAYDWLMKRDDVDADRIGLYGVSKGAEFALIAATKFEWIDAVAAIVPTDVVWEGWGVEDAAPGTRSSFSWQGKPLPFVPYQNIQAEFLSMAGGGAVLRRPHDHGRAAHPDRANAARIPVETFKGSLLVAGGMLDAVWGSGPMAQAIAERRAQVDLPTVNLVYYGAGHSLTGNGWSPTTQVDTGPMRMGGTARDTAHAQADVWAKTLDFFEAALSPPDVD